MPHFYRYRGDDDDLVARSRTPGPTTTHLPSSKASNVDEAHVSCLGMAADVCVPSGDEKNKMNLNQLFQQLDKTFQELREENRQLRKEVEALKQQRPTEVQTTVKESSVDTSSSLDARTQQLESRVTAVESQCQSCCSSVSSCQSEAKAAQSEARAGQEKLSQLEARLTKIEGSGQRPAAAADSQEAAGAPAVDVSQQLQEIKSQISSQLADFRSTVTSPFSVMFDAVRSEDWVGVDSFLPFTKVNTNLGGGLCLESGKFTAPVSGLYFFCLNVYGAPRDGVVLCIKANEFQEVANCSGVGKASQSCIVDLDEKDTVGVYVNDKSKLTDNPNQKFTHFIGMLVRPKELLL